jgi:hypothetical protein
MATCGNRARAHRHYDRAKKPRYGALGLQEEIIGSGLGL